MDDEQHLAESVRRKLGLTTAEINTLFSLDGERLLRSLRTEHGLDQGGPDDPPDRLGQQLLQAGVLTEAEAAWLDDA